MLHSRMEKQKNLGEQNTFKLEQQFPLLALEDISR